MKTQHPEIPWMDPNFAENSQKYPKDELMHYAGQHVAWSWDGTKILESAPDDESLIRKLRDAGIDPGRVVCTYVDDPNESRL